uniref:30S ribosomal protein S1 n=1 Tax=Compsopogon caeruleus TaxID=31354 RepID=A0A1Z1XB86_9RHOD|nr:30S ribosomal protein S1 [Compsopogon caeruleus]ARX96131.1 30S ribosomal protein S1 [Compsopogon caeruleus]
MNILITTIKIMCNNIYISNSSDFVTTNLKSLIEKYNYNFNTGDIVAGKCFSIESNGILVDIGAKIAGYMPLQETGYSIINHINYYELFNNREFYIIENKKGLNKLILSINYIKYIKAWERIKQLYLEDITLYTKIISKNKGGIVVDIEGLHGFIPNSHIILNNNNLKIDDYIPVKFLKIRETNNLIILSNKRLILQNNYNNLKIGENIEGIIKDVKIYGILIEIKKLKALLHISEIDRKYHQRLKEHFKIGNKIQVCIIHVDTQRARISLTMC